MTKSLGAKRQYIVDVANRQSSSRKNKLKVYFLTVRKHQVKDFVSPDDIMNVIQYISQTIPSFLLGPNCYEIDRTYRQLHFHCIAMISEYFRYKAVSTYGGFRIYWKQVYNENVLTRYIHKNNICNKYVQEEIIVNNFYTHNKAPNRFIEH